MKVLAKLNQVYFKGVKEMKSDREKTNKLKGVTRWCTGWLRERLGAQGAR